MKPGEYIDLKRTASDKKSEQETMKSSSIGGEDYPYGLTIRLSERELSKLGMKTLPKPGSVLHLEAKAHVVGTNDNQRNGKSDRSVELQLRKMWVGTEADDAKEDAEETMKRGARGVLDAALNKGRLTRKS